MTTSLDLLESKWIKKCPAMRRLSVEKRIVFDKWENIFLKIHLNWNVNAPSGLNDQLKNEILTEIHQVKLDILDSDTPLECYINEWRNFYTHCNTVPMLITTPMSVDELNRLRKFMLDIWVARIISDIKSGLQKSAMEIVNDERKEHPYDPRLVIALRECCISLCTNPDDKLSFYREYFEKAYIQAAKTFYQLEASEFLQLTGGIQEYLFYFEETIREEELRAQKYLCSHPNSVQAIKTTCVDVLVTAIYNEAVQLLKDDETEILREMKDVFCSNLALEKCVLNAGLAGTILPLKLVHQYLDLMI